MELPEEIIKDDIETLEHERSNLTAIIRTLKDRAREVLVEVVRLRAAREARKRGIEV